MRARKDLIMEHWRHVNFRQGIEIVRRTRVRDGPDTSAEAPTRFVESAADFAQRNFHPFVLYQSEMQNATFRGPGRR